MTLGLPDWLFWTLYGVGWLVSVSLVVRFVVLEDHEDESTTSRLATTMLILVLGAVMWWFVAGLVLAIAALCLPAGLVMWLAGWRPEAWQLRRARKQRHKLLREVDALPDLRDGVDR